MTAITTAMSQLALAPVAGQSAQEKDYLSPHGDAADDKT